MDNITIKELSDYRLEKAKVALSSASLLYDHGDYGGAMNRAYYSIFYALRSVLALEKTDFKRHKDVIAYFNKEYVKSEIFPRELGRKIGLAKQVREDSEYDDEYTPSETVTEHQIETARELIRLVEEYIYDKP